MSIKNKQTKNSWNQCWTPKQVWVYNVWSSVLYSFQVYYKNSNLQPWKQLSIMSISQNKTMNVLLFFFLPCYLSFDKPLRIKKETQCSNFPAWPSHHEVRCQIKIINTGIQIGFNSKNLWSKFSSCIHTNIRLSEIMSFLNPLPYS